MKSKHVTIIGISVMLGSISITSLAADRSPVALPNQEAVRMVADTVAMQQHDGYVMARGNVEIYYHANLLKTDYIEGNTNTKEYHIPDKISVLYGTDRLILNKVTYYQNHQKAVMDQAEGNWLNGAIYFRGQQVSLQDGVLHIKKGMLTTPHAVAKVPDYYVTGEDIIIDKKRKLTINNAQFWFKNTRLLSYGTYEKNIGHGKSAMPWLFSLFPKPIYKSYEGWGVTGAVSFPLNESGDLFIEGEYTASARNHIRPTLQFARYIRSGIFSIGYKEELSTEIEAPTWITKWPNVEYVSSRLYLGKSSFFLKWKIDRGYWRENHQVSGWHWGIKGEVSHQPWAIWPKAYVQGYIGFQKDGYSRQKQARFDRYGGISLTQRLTSKGWATFWYKYHDIQGKTPYRFDAIEYPRQEGVSLGYAITDKDVFLYSLTRDIDTHRLQERQYTWIRDLHSATWRATYKQVKKKWDISFVIKDL